MFLLSFISLLLMCIQQKNYFLKKIIFYNFGWFLCVFITIFLLPGSGSTFSRSGSGLGSGQMIRIRNTAQKLTMENKDKDRMANIRNIRVCMVSCSNK